MALFERRSIGCGQRAGGIDQRDQHAAMHEPDIVQVPLVGFERNFAQARQPAVKPDAHRLDEAAVEARPEQVGHILGLRLDLLMDVILGLTGEVNGRF